MNYGQQNMGMQAQQNQLMESNIKAAQCSTPAFMSPIQERIGTLDSELTELANAISVLADKINPVCMPSFPTDANQLGVKEEQTAPFIAMLNMAISHVVTQRIRISQLIDRIAL